MRARTIVITGASDGIGRAAATQLSRRGDRVLLTGRNPTKLAEVADHLGAESFVSDFASLDDVRDLATWIDERTDRIDVLANNAGGMFAEAQMTADGNERSMQVNHYAHFLLTHLLHDRLLAGGATVVNTSSKLSRAARSFDPSIVDDPGRFTSASSYAEAKLAGILFARGLHNRFHAEGINAVAIHPGVIASNFGNEGGPAVRWFYRSPLSRLFSDVDTGARNLLWAIDGIPGETWESGGYYEVSARPRKPHPLETDSALASRFWVESARRTGVATG